MRVRFSVALLGAMVVSACTGSVAPERLSFVIQGSDTEVQLVSSLVEAFTVQFPEADWSVTGGGSAVGIAALLNGETDIANSSRALNEKERLQATEKGMQIAEFILARDGLSVIVHPSNPVKDLTKEEIGAIFRGELTNWGQVGGEDRDIVLYGRQSTSGTYGFFRDAVVKDDYAVTLRQMEGSQAIVDAVSADETGIGYVGVGYAKGEDGNARSDLSVLSVEIAKDTVVSPLDKEAVQTGRYPISRPIYQYLASKPAADSPLDQFLRFEASDAGESIIESMGFYAPSAADKAANDAVLGAR